MCHGWAVFYNYFYHGDTTLTPILASNQLMCNIYMYCLSIFNIHIPFTVTIYNNNQITMQTYSYVFPYHQLTQPTCNCLFFCMIQVRLTSTHSNILIPMQPRKSLILPSGLTMGSCCSDDTYLFRYIHIHTCTYR